MPFSYQFLSACGVNHSAVLPPFDSGYSSVSSHSFLFLLVWELPSSESPLTTPGSKAQSLYFVTRPSLYSFGVPGGSLTRRYMLQFLPKFTCMLLLPPLLVEGVQVLVGIKSSLNYVGSIISRIISGKLLKTSAKASLSQGWQPPSISYSLLRGNLSHHDFKQEMRSVWCQFWC